MDIARKTAFQVLYEIEKENSYSNLTLNKFIGENRPENPAFVRELVYGTLENRIFLDYHLNALIPSGIDKVKKKEKCFLRMGLYQLMFMDSVPAYAAINETVNLAKKLCRGREGFINGVLRGYVKRSAEIQLPDREKDPMGYLSVKYSFPLWIIELWQQQYGEELCEKLLEASNGSPALAVRVNLLKTDRETLAQKLSRRGFSVSKGEFSQRTLYVEGAGLLDTDLYKDGFFSVQDEASTLAAEFVEPKAYDTVIDVCAAPGGKTTAIGEAMANKGVIFSCDVYPHKLKLIKKQAERTGLTIVETMLLDGRKGNRNFDGKADKVLVDAPCSGLGVIRRKPEIKYKEREDFSQLVQIQKEILERSARYIKPGGTLVYSTCTINRQENREQIENFLANNGEFAIEEMREFLPTEGLDGFFLCKMVRQKSQS